MKHIFKITPIDVFALSLASCASTNDILKDVYQSKAKKTAKLQTGVRGHLIMDKIRGVSKAITFSN